MAYTSVEFPKSARERYIRVVAIDIVISEGIKNIFIEGRMRNMIKEYCLRHSFREQRLT